MVRIIFKVGSSFLGGRFGWIFFIVSARGRGRGSQEGGWNRVLGRGCDEAEISEEKRLSLNGVQAFSI